MSRKFVSLYAIFAIAVCIVSIAVTGARILSSRSNKAAAASEDFEELKGFIASTYSKSGDFASDSFRAEMKARYKQAPSLILLFIYNHGLGPDYVVPASSPYIVAKPGGKESWTGYPSLSYPSISVRKLSSSLSLPGRVGTGIDALYTILPANDIFIPVRDSFIALAALVLLTCIVMVVRVAGERSEASSEPDGGEDSRFSFFEGSRPGDGDEFVKETVPHIPEGSHPLAAREEGPSAAFEEAPPDEDYAIPEMRIEDTVNDEIDAIPPEAQEMENVRAEEVQELESPESLEERAMEIRGEAPAGAEEKRANEPVGLFSPYSGLGWEMYFEERLQSELSRAASFEQDLVILFVTMEGLTKESEIYHAIAESVPQFFSFRDLCFEFRGTGFAVILPNIDLDHGMKMSEEFLKKITFRLTEFRDPLDYLSLFIGMSSRAGRLIEAKRIIEEASRALEKAAAEKDTHIVAFRPNPDKYRSYLTGK